HPFPWFNLGMTHNHLGNYKEAIPALEKSMALSKPFESTVRKLYAMLVNSYWQLGEQDAARANLDAGLTRFPNDPELLFRAAQMYHNLGDPAHAEQVYLKLLNSREVGHIDSLDVSMTTYKALQNLGTVYMDMGRPEQAERCFLRAIEHYPQFIPAWH